MGKAKNKHKRKKKMIRSTMSGKVVNGREVILASEAKDYVTKLGYELKPIKMITALICAVFLSLLIIPVVSASMFTIDLSQSSNRIIFLIPFAISILLFIFREKLWSGLIFFIMGVVMFANQLNFVISLLIFLIGIFIIGSTVDNS